MVCLKLWSSVDPRRHNASDAHERDGRPRIDTRVRKTPPRVIGYCSVPFELYGQR